MGKGYHWIITPQMLAHPENRVGRDVAMMAPLTKKLLSFGGKYVAYPPIREKTEVETLSWFVNLVLENGRKYEPSDAQIFTGRVGRVTMPRPRQCHNNTSRLFDAKKIAAIGSGWSLQPNEDIWHRHSWGIAEDGKVWETTPPCRICFGCAFGGDDVELERFQYLTAMVG